LREKHKKEILAEKHKKKTILILTSLLNAD
jgi:hypothetical protein